jgi:hypothetical protein
MPMIFFAGFKIGWFGLLSKDKRKGSIWSCSGPNKPLVDF